MKGLTEQFIDELLHCGDPIIFIGVANVLGIKLIEGENQKDIKAPARDFYNVANDVVNAFDELDRKKKRELLKIFKKANKTEPEVKDNAARTKDSETATKD